MFLMFYNLGVQTKGPRDLDVLIQVLALDRARLAVSLSLTCVTTKARMAARRSSSLEQCLLTVMVRNVRFRSELYPSYTLIVSAKEDVFKMNGSPFIIWDATPHPQSAFMLNPKRGTQMLSRM